MKNHPILIEIATLLNGQVALGAALRECLKHTVNSLDLSAGWIWLVAPDGEAVYLAAAHQLPTALKEHPERLAGWCWCIEKYLAGDLAAAGNISEVRCSRLNDLPDIIAGLRYHASIPLFTPIDGRKMGILNLLHDEQRELSKDELGLLHEIGNLLASAIARAEQFDRAFADGTKAGRQAQAQLMQKIWQPELSALQARLKALATEPQEPQNLRALAQRVAELAAHLLRINDELSTVNNQPLRPAYPSTPLTERELEVLQAIAKGQINRSIGEALFISERTVKFHVSAILQKLGADNRTEAVKIARERRWLS